MNHKIIVIGATGMLGKPVTEELIKAGYDVKILSRNPQKAKGLFPDVENIEQCDLKDKEKLVEALRGYDFLYMNLSVGANEKESDFHPERDGLKNALEAAKEAGIKRIGYISSIISRDFNTDWWVFKIKREAVQLIKNSGIPYVIFYPSSFMETLVRSIQKGKLMVAGKAKFKNWWISGNDYGKQVAAAFKVIPENESRDYTVQGPEALTFNEAAEIFVKNYFKDTLKVSTAPLWLLKLIGLFSTQMNYLTKILDVINNHPETFMAEDTWKELGKPETTVADFARNLK